jgi:hypothetical protein
VEFGWDDCGPAAAAKTLGPTQITPTQTAISERTDMVKGVVEGNGEAGFLFMNDVFGE